MKLKIFIVQLLDPSVIMVGEYDFYWETFAKVDLYTNSGIIQPEKASRACTIKLDESVYNSS